MFDRGVIRVSLHSCVIPIANVSKYSHVTRYTMAPYFGMKTRVNNRSVWQLMAIDTAQFMQGTLNLCRGYTGLIKELFICPELARPHQLPSREYIWKSLFS